jgi:hypothetical protein
VTRALPADPERIAREVVACPGVAGLADGVGTYLPGRRVAGVAVRAGDPPVVEVHVVGAWGPTMAEIAAQVRAAVRKVAPAILVTVVIEDLQVGSGRHPSDQVDRPADG